jgi:hypothetical protein
VLLVEPNYKTKFPSMGLMKISSYHKKLGDSVLYVKGESMYLEEPDIIYITSIFTYDYMYVRNSIQFYRQVFPKAKIWVGGLVATLMPEKFEDLGVDYIHKGIWDEVEDECLDYSLHPELNMTIMFTHRGCPRKCPWCVVPVHESLKFKKDIGKYIVPEFDKISCWDNNALANPKLSGVIEVFKQAGKEVDFNQSLDIRLLTIDKAKLLKQIKIYPMRFAFDDIKYKDAFLKGVEICKSVGLKQETRIDVLYNFEDTPEDFYERLSIILDTGWMAYPMLYKPIRQVDKEWLGKHWTKEDLDRYQNFCKSLLGRVGDFLNPRSYVYFKNKRIKIREVIKNRILDIPSKDDQRRFYNESKGIEEKNKQFLF